MTASALCDLSLSWPRVGPPLALGAANVPFKLGGWARGRASKKIGVRHPPRIVNGLLRVFPRGTLEKPTPSWAKATICNVQLASHVLTRLDLAKGQRQEWLRRQFFTASALKAWVSGSAAPSSKLLYPWHLFLY
jgi:hypothetical protein